jgi:hypothetical protein
MNESVMMDLPNKEQMIIMISKRGNLSAQGLD